MFGRNKIMQAEFSNGYNLKVVNIFRTIQGEGPFAGRPAIFIRLGGCNLACSFCDTEFDKYQEYTLSEILNETNNLAKLGDTQIKLIVITGGEPLRQPINNLCEELKKQDYRIQIETNGTILRPLTSDISIVCSPKITNRKYHITKMMIDYVSCFKFIISKNHIDYNHVPIFKTSKEIFIQPMDELDINANKDNINYCIELALKHNYRISLQTHKTLDIE